ncbi:MAG: ABC transporter ATP-binding protein [Vicinamibacterales bacterium]
MLSLVNVTVAYGHIVALRGVSLDVKPGTISLLAGANGAGKSSLLRACSGLVVPAAGTIAFEGQPLGGVPAHRVASMGIAHVPEGRRIWPTLSVREHLLLASHRVAPARRRTLEEEIVSLFPRLKERWTQDAARMSGGEQQMLAIARGLAADPRLLVIDELSLGLAPVVVSQLFKALQAIHARGVTLLLVEQALHQALACAHYGFVLENGRLVVEGTPAELRDNEAVRKAYLAV